jgi:two-component system cell cycle sensor histidine kinase/response regulator CckA
MKILHLEDNPHDAELVRELLLEDWPDGSIKTVVGESDYRAALAAEVYDVIISDFTLVRFDGASALKVARELAPGTPFIYVSGTIGEERAIEAVHAGAADYVIKDRMQRLTTAVRRALRESEERHRRQETEAALRLSNERFQLVARATNDAVWDWNLLTDALWWNESHSILFRYPPDPAGSTGAIWLARIHPDDRARIHDGIHGAIDRGLTTWADEYRYQRADGSYAHVLDRGYVLRDATGKPYRMLGSIQDITERKQAHAAVIRERDFSDAVLNSLPGVFYLYDEQLKFIRWNPRFAEVTGYTDSEIAHMSPLDFFTGKHREVMQARINEVFARGLADVEADFVTKNHAHIPYFFTGSLILVDGRRCLIGVGTDITEKRKLQEQFLRSQRLEGIGMLAAGIAHDLNNVLTPILMAGPMLRVRATDPLDQRLLKTLENSAERGAALVRQILAFAHGTTGEPRLMQIKHLARDIVEMIEETFPKAIKLETHFPADTWPIRANPTQIHQVLLNLCVNARDAMPRGGTLRLRTTNRPLDPAQALAIPGARAGNFVTIEVEDSGTGIAPETLKHAWEPFFTTKETGKGTGLGLSTVRGIVESHQGFVELETAVGRGTTFRVSLPAAEADTPADSRTAPPFLPRGDGQLLLLVDDEATNRDVTHATLARYGYRVLAASSGTEAVSLFIPRADEIRLLITDLHMPNLDGASLTRILQRIKPGLKVLAISGLTSEPTGGATEKPDQFANDYLPKPFKPESLLLKIHQLLQPPA